MAEKKKILVFVDWYLPGYKAGGPIQSVSNIVENLKEEFDFSIFTSDTDLGEMTPYANIESDTWLTIKKVRIFYASKKFLSFFNILKVIKQNKVDVIYFNSFFSFYFTIIPLILCKILKKSVLLAPRGMIEKKALKIKSTKKKIFIAITKMLGIYNNITWHASSESEKKDIVDLFGNQAEIVIAMNLTKKYTETYSYREKTKDRLQLFYLGRIAKVKNILTAIEYLEKVTVETKIDFSLIGPIDENDYWNRCKDRICNLKSNIHIHYLGGIPNQNIKNYLPNFHFLLMPTYGENFGHSILESLSFGCPVIISDKTPWKNLEEKEVGWDISLSKPERFVEIIEYCARMEQDEYCRISRSAYEYARDFSLNKKNIEQNRKLFSSS